MKIKEKEVEELLNLEWIETNGLGGYASSTITGANTRKYHGLLVAPYNPPVNRKILVGKIEERIFTNGNYTDLSLNEYPEGSIHPKGHQYLSNFTRKPIATWQYNHQKWSLKKQLFMVQGSNTTVLTYENNGTIPFVLEMHPLWVFKDHHNHFKETSKHFEYTKHKDHIKVKLSDNVDVYWDWSEGEFIKERSWYKNFQLHKEKFRGEVGEEDFYRIGYVKLIIDPGQKIKISFTTEEKMVGKKIENLELNKKRYLKGIVNNKIKNTFYNDLLVAGHQFLVRRDATKSKTIIAGYHWFTDWGRDTMIAMRGLTIATGNQKASKSLLSTFLKYTSKGMLPNRFPDFTEQKVAYNTIDATLWLFVAMYEYHQKFNDLEFIQKNIKALEKIILRHVRGTRYNIHVTQEGFLYGGQEGVQLTWMDALVDGHVITPRMGCPVEINALWYNALCIFESFATECTIKIKREVTISKRKFLKNFKNYFLNDKGYLNDVVEPGKRVDNSFRPNQIYAISLPFSLLTQKEEKQIVEMVEEKLLTPYGLRTLDSSHPDFKGKYHGHQWNRDMAYHQGTVWPFILMDYYEAFLKTKKHTLGAKKKVVKALKPLENHFYNQNGIHAISEIFDGERPLEGRGCIHQAWSVAALIKLYNDYKLYDLY